MYTEPASYAANPCRRRDRREAKAAQQSSLLETEEVSGEPEILFLAWRVVIQLFPL